VQIEQVVRIPCSLDQAWALLADVPRVVPCMPGSELVAVKGDDAWAAKMRMQVGPMRMVFGVELTRRAMHASTRTIVLDAVATEQKGRGSATAVLTCSLDAGESGETEMRTMAELALAGRLAQFAHGIVEQLASDMTRDFAQALAAELEDGDGPLVVPPAPVTPATAPASAGPASAMTPVTLSPGPAAARSNRVGRKLLPALVRAVGAYLRGRLRRSHRSVPPR
jgi:uncharacterized protein